MSKLKLTLKNGDITFIEDSDDSPESYIGLFWDRKCAWEPVGPITTYKEKQIIACEVVDEIKVDEIKFEVVLTVPAIESYFLNKYLFWKKLKPKIKKNKIIDFVAEHQETISVNLQKHIMEEIELLLDEYKPFNYPVQPNDMVSN